LKILVIAAHPDDEILGVGGTILKHSINGDEVEAIILATGITSRIGESKDKIEKLRVDSKKVCKLLKMKKVTHHNFPDNKMDSVPLLDVVKVIEDKISKFKPEKIFTHHYNDLNIDHRITYQATLTACRPINSTVNEIICFEIPSSTEWNYPQKFNPNYFVNISKQLKMKIKAMETYKGEIRKFPHPRSSKYLKVLAEKWGAVSGNNAAEAFEIIRKIE
jgi:LmbE family N-acetylglucosaminyl deacetylase